MLHRKSKLTTFLPFAGVQVKKQALDANPVPTDAAATLKAEPAKAALPAFLSSKSIDEVYGSKKVEGKATEK